MSLEDWVHREAPLLQTVNCWDCVGGKNLHALLVGFVIITTQCVCVCGACECMCVRLCMRVCAPVYDHVYVVHVSVCVYMSVYVRVYPCVCLCVCTCVFRVCVHVHMRVHTYRSMSVEVQTTPLLSLSWEVNLCCQACQQVHYPLNHLL